MLSVIMLCVIMLCVIMLNVVAPSGANALDYLGFVGARERKKF